jgi:AraC-like DNA-binding protein
MTCEDAFAVHVAMRPANVDFRLGGANVPNEGDRPGGVYLLDLQASTMVNFNTAFDIVRFHISAPTLEVMSREAGQVPCAGLKRPKLGAYDPVLYHLARAMLPALERPDEASTLFVDHIAHAFHAHVVRTYAGGDREPTRARQALTSWQARIAAELISSRLDGKLPVQELASACNLSVSHFSRAFVQTFGMPPHRWLLVRRIDSAKELISQGKLSLLEVANACGFATQSHFTRIFTSMVGTPPSRWGRMANRQEAFERVRQSPGAQ